MDRIDDRLQRDLRLPCRPARRRLIGSHEPLGDRHNTRQLRRETAFIGTGNGAFTLDGRVVAHGAVRARVVHLCVINDAVGGVLILKVIPELIGKGLFLWVKVAFLNLDSARLRVAFVNRKVVARIRLFSVQIIGEHVAAHVGLELALVESDRPLDVRRCARSVGLVNHVVAECNRLSRSCFVVAVG